MGSNPTLSATTLLLGYLEMAPPEHVRGTRTRTAAVEAVDLQVG